MTDKTKRRMRIYQDEVKLRHTSHWDIDSMSRAELEAYMAGEIDLPNSNPPASNPPEPAPACALAQHEAGAHACSSRPPAPPPTLWQRFLRACLPAR